MAIGIVGAFERDNFGDILFLERMCRYAEDNNIDVLPLAPFCGQREQLRGAQLPTISEALLGDQVSALWTVGGEVGGVNLRDAYRMSTSTEEYAAFAASPRAVRKRILVEESGLDPRALAYLPAPDLARTDLSTPLYVNSAGLRGLSELRRSQLTAILPHLRRSPFISVREAVSSAVLRSLGVHHRVAPDVVHTLRLDTPHQKDPKTDLVLVQFSEAAAGRHAEEMAYRLAESDILRRSRLRFFSAGAAPGHDSHRLYEQVAYRYRELTGNSVEYSTAATALEKVREIAEARLVIGTSLHLMIVASAYDVPRVGLMLHKLQSYAATWGDPMPIGVAVSNVDAAVTAAVSLGESGRVAIGEELALLADENMQAGLRAIRDPQADNNNRRVGRLHRRDPISRARLAIQHARLPMV